MSMTSNESSFNDLRSHTASARSSQENLSNALDACIIADGSGELFSSPHLLLWLEAPNRMVIHYFGSNKDI